MCSFHVVFMPFSCRLHTLCTKNGYASCHNGSIGGDAWESGSQPHQTMGYHHSRALRGAFDGKFRIKSDLNRSKYFKSLKSPLPLAKPWNCDYMKASPKVTCVSFHMTRRSKSALNPSARLRLGIKIT